MYKLAVMNDASRIAILVMKAEDFQAYREKPLFDHSRIDGTPFGRPDIMIFITHATNRTQARTYMREHISAKHTLSYGNSGIYCFDGKMMEKSVMGIIMTETALARLEAKPLGNFETFEGSQFGLPGFQVMITYSNSDKAFVSMMRGLGMTLETIATDPVLEPLWRRYSSEIIRDSVKIANRYGANIKPEDNIPYEVHLGNPKDANVDVLLAVRGEEVAWFAQNPNETEYYRRMVPGEFPPDVTSGWVRVIKGEEEGLRYRVPGDFDGSTFVQFKLGEPPA
jgi:hypothetical protein